MDGMMVNMADVGSVSAFHARVLKATQGVPAIDEHRELFEFDAEQLAAAETRFRDRWGHDAYYQVQKAMLEPSANVLMWGKEDDPGEFSRTQVLSGRAFGIRVSCYLHVDLPDDMRWEDNRITLTFPVDEFGGMSIPAEAFEAQATLQVEGLSPLLVHEAVTRAIGYGFQVSANIASGALTMEKLTEMGVFAMTEPHGPVIEGKLTE